MRIAIAGRAGSGKSTIANYLVKNYGFVKYSFAEKLKDLARELFDMEGKDRPLLQRFGEALRFIDEMVWIRQVLNQIEEEGHDNIVIDDLRYVNEATWLRANGFMIVKIVGDRFYKLPAGQKVHSSETEYYDIHPDYVIDTSGMIEASFAMADELVAVASLDQFKMQLEYFRRVEVENRRPQNQNYKRGRNFEYRVMRTLRLHGWHCMRKFGSHDDNWRQSDGSVLKVSLDVTAFKDGVYLLISCKYSIHGPTGVEQDSKWENLRDYAKLFGATAIPVLAGIDERRHIRLIDLRTLGPFDLLAKRMETRGRKAKPVDVDLNQMQKLLDFAWGLMEDLRFEYEAAKEAKNDKMRVRWAGEMVKHINILNRLLKSAGETATEEDITEMLLKLDEGLEKDAKE